VYLTAGWPTLAIIGGALLAVLVVTFQAGVRYAQKIPKANRPTETAQPREFAQPAPREAGGTPVAQVGQIDVPAAGQPEASAAQPPANEPPAQPAAFDFRAGYHYVVVQHFPKSRRDDALNAARFLQSHSVPCVVVPRPRDIELIAKDAFLIKPDGRRVDEAEKRRCEELKRRIKELGKLYVDTGGYAFEQCYERLRTN